MDLDVDEQVIHGRCGAAGLEIFVAYDGAPLADCGPDREENRLVRVFCRQKGGFVPWAGLRPSPVSLSL